MDYDTIHNIVGKDQNHIRTVPGGVDIPQHKTTYDWMYTYAASQPHAASLIGDRAYTYDANGNQTGWDHVSNGTRRTITWDEENRVQAIADNGHTLTYVYDDAGERVIKSGPQGETAYVNQFFVVRNREVATKHVFAGGTRLVSKMASQPDVTPPTAGNSGQAPWGWLHSNAGGNSPNSGGTVFEKDQYYFHPDHLGSSSYVTDIDGEIFQHLEYFPFGETFVEESSNTQRTPYLFTGKELDEETGLYYFGARYYDPRTSVWQSPDPILASYMRGSPNGGVFNPRKLSLYSYAQNKPVILIDPNGLHDISSCASNTTTRGCRDIPSHYYGHDSAEAAAKGLTPLGAAEDLANADTLGEAGVAAVGLVPAGKYITKAWRGARKVFRGLIARRNVKWVGENASMRPNARAYEDAAVGARPGQAPAINRTLENGTLKPVRFDGLDDGVLIDRKRSIFTSDKTRDTIRRQSQALSENGMTARWEVPIQAEANRAQRLFDEAGVTNITVRVVPE